MKDKTENQKNNSQEENSGDVLDGFWTDKIEKMPLGKLPDAKMFPTMTKLTEEFVNYLDTTEDALDWISALENFYKDCLKKHDAGEITLNSKEMTRTIHIMSELWKFKNSKDDIKAMKKAKEINSMLKEAGIDVEFVRSHSENIFRAIELACRYGAGTPEMEMQWKDWKKTNG